jgi:hypothetical protein
MPDLAANPSLGNLQEGLGAGRQSSGQTGRAESNLPTLIPIQGVLMSRSVFFSIAAVLIAVGISARGAAQGAPVAFPSAPTSLDSFYDPRLPQPPTPSGSVPNTTLPQPFAVLPYYYHPSVYNASPYMRYLRDSPYYYRAYDPVPPLNIRTYDESPYQSWPQGVPLH